MTEQIVTGVAIASIIGFSGAIWGLFRKVQEISIQGIARGESIDRALADIKTSNQEQAKKLEEIETLFAVHEKRHLEERVEILKLQVDELKKLK